MRPASHYTSIRKPMINKGFLSVDVCAPHVRSKHLLSLLYALSLC
jgi:hypothetical protein